MNSSCINIFWCNAETPLRITVESNKQILTWVSVESKYSKGRSYHNGITHVCFTVKQQLKRVRYSGQQEANLVPDSEQ